MEVEGSSTKFPFTLFITNNNGSMTDSELPCNSDRFIIGNNKAITVEIHEDIYEKAYEEQLMEAFEMHSSARENKAKHSDAAKVVRIQECFQKFVEREQLGESDPWYCSSCKKHQRAYKKFDLWSAPDILIIHLKRFLYLPGTYFVHRQKIDDLVDFPIEGLDLAEFILGPKVREAPPVYDLYAVSEHSGGLGGGHYTAMAKKF
jgi:ubiquitin carboxyl-terminal hydrolase 4/11/15